MNNAKNRIRYFLWIILVVAACKKESTVEQESNHPETRSARITKIERTDKDFRQYFYYGTDGLLDTIRREGDVLYVDPQENYITVIHEPNQIHFHNIRETYTDGAWKNIMIKFENDIVSETYYELTGVVAVFQTWNLGNKFHYLTNKKLSSVDFYHDDFETSRGYTKDMLLDNDKIKSYTLMGTQLSIPIQYDADPYPDSVNFEFSYTTDSLTPPNVKNLINNGLLSFLRLGEDVFYEWENFSYGLYNYKLPIQVSDELISQIHIKGYSAEDGSLLLDSTAVFDYQVDTLNKTITFGNQILTYEFLE